ncbi:MAG: glycosyltransferase [Candidatus Latescibacteria bacterium]|nr:glycosyltransferase [Candidatus Latescibacterota bacterium]
MKNVLILSYYFPPMGLGGVQRPLKFAKYLPRFSWRPIIVTVKDVRYHGHDDSLLQELPSDALVYRTGSYDPLRISHRLETKGSPSANPALGRSLARWLLFPDNQVGWVPFAVKCALDIVRDHQIDALFSTFPPASAHLAASIVKRSTGLPWVADFRDSWLGGEFNQPPTNWHHHLMKRTGRKLVRTADHLVSVTDHIATQLSEMRGTDTGISVITNGYDPEDFQSRCEDRDDGKFVLTYCGSMTRDRDPVPLFRGLRHLLDRRPDLAELISIRLIGTSIGLDVAGLISYYRLHKTVSVIGYLAHRKAVSFLAESDAVILLVTSPEEQSKCVPTGKFYECAATGLPILCLSSDTGSPSWIVENGRGVVLSPGDTMGIGRAVEMMYERHSGDDVIEFDETQIAQFSRLGLTEKLGRILDDVSTR